MNFRRAIAFFLAVSAAGCGPGARTDAGLATDSGPAMDAASPADSGGTPGSDAGGATCPGFPPPPQSGAGTTYYVSPSGDDADPGTETAPFATIQAAADVVLPGDTVVVEDGTYTRPGSAAIVFLDAGGAPGDFVWFRARNRWGALLDGGGGVAAGGNAAGLRFGSGIGYVRIEGFEITGVAADSGGAGGIECYAGGHDTELVANHLHDIGHICTETSNGLVGIFLQQPNVLVEGNLFHDIGRFAPGENGCTLTPGNDYWMNHDHGVYVDGDADGSAPGASGAIIRNNVFYAFVHGWPIQLFPGTLAGVVIANNTFSGTNPNRDGHIVIYDMDLSDSEIVNNIFDGAAGAALSLGGTLTFANVTVASDLTSAPAMTTIAPPAGMTVTGALLSTPAGFAAAASADFHLAAGSAAIDAGAMRPDVALDYDGCTRPVGAAWDIGAFER